jgi:hypothetical protein
MLAKVFVQSGGKIMTLTDKKLLQCTKPAWELASNAVNNELA